MIQERLMAISGDYSIPISVNGYSCRNCTDVAYAKKNIDPADPTSGPFGVNAVGDPMKAQTSRIDSTLAANAVTATGSTQRLLDIRV